MTSAIRMAFIVMCTIAFVSPGKAAEVVSLKPTDIPKVGQDESVKGFLESRPFDQYMKCISDSLLSDTLYPRLFGFDDGIRVQSGDSNLTSAVVGRITEVRLLLVSAANSNVSAYVAWYVARVEVMTPKKGNFPTGAFSFLFTDHIGHANFYVWPYLPGLVYEFGFIGRQLVCNRPVSCFPPYSQKTVKEWNRFRKENAEDTEWILKKWVPILQQEVVNIHLESDEFVILSSVPCYSMLGYIKNYNDVTRTIISLKTREIVEPEDFLKPKDDATLRTGASPFH